MIKNKLKDYYNHFKKIPPWKIISGGILVIILSGVISFLAVPKKPSLIIDREFLKKETPRQENVFWLNFFNKAKIKNIGLDFKKGGISSAIEGRITSENENFLTKIYNLTRSLDYRLKLFKKRNGLKLAGQSAREIDLPAEILIAVKNFDLAPIYLVNNLSLEKIFEIDNLEANLSADERKTILKILSQTKELVIAKKDKGINNLTSFDYFGAVSSRDEKDLASFENLFSKIISIIQPAEKVKILPDGSRTVELISQPEKFSFQDERYLNFSFRCQKAPEIGWQICYLKDKNKIYFATNLDWLKEKLNQKTPPEIIDLSNNPEFLNDDKVIILKKDLLNYSELAKKIFSPLPDSSHLLIVELGDGFKIHILKLN